MLLALEEAKKCESKPGAFSVGCLLVSRLPNSPSPTILAHSYSRELPGNTHAEANALEKARSLSLTELRERLGLEGDNFPAIDDVLHHTDVYTTMEPCSVRTSGLAPCADALISAHVTRCIIGVGEPADFVNCEGARKLKEAGVKVVWLKGLEEQCLEVARKGHEGI